MLHTQTVEPRTLSLLKDLMALPALKDFCLVGETALALKYGHRNSIDLEFFSYIPPDFMVIERELQEKYGNEYVCEAEPKRIGIFCYIKGVKIDVVKYPHLPIAAYEIQDGLSMYGDPDLAAMKIQAILGRARKKDFWDLFELLQHYKLEQIIEWHYQKYPSQLLAISIPNAITYFTEADASDTPVSYKGQTWAKVKKAIQLAVREYLA